jgi:hypothetical protein
MLAFADEPPSNAPVVNPQALAVAEGAMNYCAPIDPTAAARLRQMIQQLMQGAGERQLAEVRNSDEYRKTYDSVADFTAKIDPHNAKRFCAEQPGGRG